VGQSSPKFFRGCYPVRLPIMPNFIEIGHTSLEKWGVIGPWSQNFFHFVTDGQKCNYLSRTALREAQLKMHISSFMEITS